MSGMMTIVTGKKAMIEYTPQNRKCFVQIKLIQKRLCLSYFLLKSTPHWAVKSTCNLLLIFICGSFSLFFVAFDSEVQETSGIMIYEYHNLPRIFVPDKRFALIEHKTQRGKDDENLFHKQIKESLRKYTKQEEFETYVIIYNWEA